MLRKLNELKKKTEGFTIIEVLIVLAIGALIIVIVLVAIPQLQRNQRNTARKNDVSRVATSVNEYSSNNNGKVPAATKVVVDSIIDSIGDLAQYTFTKPADDAAATAVVGANTLTVETGTQTAIAGSATTVTAVVIVTGARCGTAGATTSAAGRAVAFQYVQETGSGAYVSSCIDG